MYYTTLCFMVSLVKIWICWADVTYIISVPCIGYVPIYGSFPHPFCKKMDFIENNSLWKSRKITRSMTTGIATPKVFGFTFKRRFLTLDYMNNATKQLHENSLNINCGCIVEKQNQKNLTNLKKLSKSTEGIIAPKRERDQNSKPWNV